jgi:serine-type D-Ala-D-Ala carboxypeptidase (penicillin-binding protein 5/6)
MLIRWLLGTVFICVLGLQAEPLKISVQADAAILMNADTGAILFQKNPHALHYPASTTKIATAALALKKAGNYLDVMVTAQKDALVTIKEEERTRSNYTLPAYWMTTDGAHMGIKVGETMSLRNFLYGVMVVSANDACNVVAQHISGSVPKFVEEINAYMKEIGCLNSFFRNPHGLHDPKHKTTAYDLAILTKEALKNPVFREIVSTVRFTRPKTNKQESVTLLQTNRLLRPGPFNYPKAIGVKTGHHSKAKQTFVAAAKQPDGRTLIAVLLHCKERNLILRDTTNLFEAAFNQPKVNRIYLKSGAQTFQSQIPGADKPLQTYTKENLNLEFYPAEDPNAKCYIFWKELSLPIKKGDAVGELRLTDSGGKVLKQVSLYASDEVKMTWLHWMKGKTATAFRPGIPIAILWGSVLAGTAFVVIPRIKK